MVNFGIYLFVVIKGYCQVAMMLPDLLHDTSVADELTDCAQYLSHISFTAVCSRVFCHQAHQDLIWCIEACNWTVILFIAKIFRFWKQNSSSGQHHSGIITVSMYRSVNAFLNTFCVSSTFFHQKFGMSSILGAVQFFHLAISFFIFLSVMANSLTRFALLLTSAFTSSIHSIFGVDSFYP